MLSRSGKKILLVAALLTLGLLIAYVLVRGSTKDGGKTAVAAVTEPQPAAPARQPGSPPAFDVDAKEAMAFHAALPLAERHRTLVQLAQAGSEAASCYLGISLTKCSRSTRLRQQAKALEMRAATLAAGSIEEQDAIDQLVAINRRIEALEAFCGTGLWDSDHDAFDYLIEAANRGSESATVFLATAPPLDVDKPLADVERWAEYKAEVPKLLDAAARNGSLTAMHLALGIYSGTDWIVAGGGRFIEPDLVRALAYATVLEARTDHPGLRRHFQAMVGQLRVKVGALRSKHADKLAASLLDRQFPAAVRVSSLADLSVRRQPADCISRANP